MVAPTELARREAELEPLLVGEDAQGYRAMALAFAADLPSLPTSADAATVAEVAGRLEDALAALAERLATLPPFVGAGHMLDEIALELCAGSFAWRAAEFRSTARNWAERPEDVCGQAVERLAADLRHALAEGRAESDRMLRAVGLPAVARSAHTQEAAEVVA